MDIARPIKPAEEANQARPSMVSPPSSPSARITLGLSRLKPAAPGVERATVWIDTVKRGPMVRDVRGRARWCRKTSAGFRRRRRGASSGFVLRPGTTVDGGQRHPRAEQPAARTGAAGGRAQAERRRGSLANLRVQVAERRARSRKPRRRASRPITRRRRCRSKRTSSSRRRASSPTLIAEAVEARRRPAVGALCDRARSSSPATPSRCRRGSPCSSRRSIRRARSCS